MASDSTFAPFVGCKRKYDKITYVQALRYAAALFGEKGVWSDYCVMDSAGGKNAWGWRGFCLFCKRRDTTEEGVFGGSRPPPVKSGAGLGRDSLLPPKLSPRGTFRSNRDSHPSDLFGSVMYKITSGFFQPVPFFGTGES